MLFVAGMWFQDLFNYDFRRTEMCIIPYGTQMGEISLLRLQHRRRLAEHHREDEGQRDRRRVVPEKGRHPVYAKNQELPLPESLGTLVMPPTALDAEAAADEAAPKKRVRLQIVA